MKLIPALVTTLLAATLFIARQSARAEVDMGIMKEAQADLEAGKTDACLAKLSKLLAHTSAFERTIERGKLLVMKGECLLQLKQSNKALEAFGSAAASFPLANTKEIAIASATGELLKKCTDLQYVPRTGGDNKPISVSDAKTRPNAFQAFFRDELSERQETLKTMQKTAPFLPAVAEFADKVRDLSAIEIAATGSDTQTRLIQRDFADIARKSIDSNVGLLIKQADFIQTESVKSVTVAAGPNKGTHARGITIGEKNILNGMLATAKKVTELSTNLKVSLGLDGDYFKKQVDDAANLKTKAESTLRTAKVN